MRNFFYPNGVWRGVRAWLLGWLLLVPSLLVAQINAPRDVRLISAERPLVFKRGSLFERVDLSAENKPAALRWGGALAGDFSVSVWLWCATPPNGVGAMEKPMALWELRNDASGQRLALQLSRARGIPELIVPKAGVLSGMGALPLDTWNHLVVVYANGTLSLYVNGSLYGQADFVLPPGWDTFTLGWAGSRAPMQGAAAFPRIYPAAVDGAHIAQVAKNAGYFSPADISQNRTNHFGRYPALQVASAENHPLIDHLHVGAAVVPWSGTGSHDLIVRGQNSRFYGTRTALFRQVGRDAHNLPVYDTGTTLPDLPGARFLQLPRADGLFDLVALGEATPFGIDNLVRIPNTGTIGSPAFGEAQRLRVNGTSLKNAFDARVLAWHVADIDGDGVEDLVVATAGQGGGSYWFDKGKAIWDGHDRKEAGRGRGYDATGRWLGGEMISELFWAKGSLDSSGELSFGEPKQVYDRLPDYPWRWKSWTGDRALSTYRDDAGLWLLQAGRQDQLIATQIAFKDDQWVSPQTLSVLDGIDPRTQETYFVVRINVVDMDGDGVQEIVLDGNPGRIAVLKGDRVGIFKEIGPLQMRGGPLAADTLTVPVRTPWSKEGLADLITGDASGRLLLWEGTDDPLTYHAAKPFTVNGVSVRHLSGEINGSVQGPGEAPWGYLQPTVGVWGDDGEKVIIANDVRSDLVLYRRAGGPTELSAPEMFTHKGKRLPISWRSRPDILPKALNYGDTKQANLLYVDWDGELAVAIPESPGSTKIARTEKLRYEDGSPIKLCADGGLWGRTKLSVVDWTGDGRWDVVLGGSGANQRFILPEPFNKAYGAMPLLLENVGTNAAPVFKALRPITQKGELIDVGAHVASVWASDLNGDGQADLLIGAEDGKVYYFMREDLAW